MTQLTYSNYLKNYLPDNLVANACALFCSSFLKFLSLTNIFNCDLNSTELFKLIN